MYHIPPILILGLGNILLSDDGFGVHIIKLLVKDKEIAENKNIEIIEGGTLGLQLLEEIQSRELVVVVDAVKGDQVPGSLYNFTYSDITSYYQDKSISLHQLDFVKALEIGDFLDKDIPEIQIVGVQPESLKVGMKLSMCVEEQVPKVLNKINELISMALNI